MDSDDDCDPSCRSDESMSSGSSSGSSSSSSSSDDSGAEEEDVQDSAESASEAGETVVVVSEATGGAGNREEEGQMCPEENKELQGLSVEKIMEMAIELIPLIENEIKNASRIRTHSLQGLCSSVLITMLEKKSSQFWEMADNSRFKELVSKMCGVLQEDKDSLITGEETMLLPSQCKDATSAILGWRAGRSNDERLNGMVREYLDTLKNDLGTRKILNPRKLMKRNVGFIG